jgi:lysozyme
VASRRVSPHFTEAEFAEHTGAPAPAGYLMWVTKLCHDYLEPLRAEFGPVTIVSGWRSTAYNASVGGAPLSYHRRIAGRRGSAVDLQCHKGRPSDWYRHLDRAGAPGLGLYPTWVHVDNRGERARW